MAVLEVVRGHVGDSVVPGLVARALSTRHVALAAWVERDAARLLGRYHPDGEGTPARRRHTGGRVVAIRPGHVRLALAMPHRSGVESADRLALRPEQAMNRCVRGLLDACRALGSDAVYPGRDLVTVGGVPIAWLALTEEERGGAVFEAGLWMSELSGSSGEVAAALAEAYRVRPWEGVVDVEAEDLPVTDRPDLTWRIPASADRMGEVQTMLGSLSAHVGIDERRRVVAARIAGDVMAPVETMRAIEDALLEVPALRSEVERAVGAVLADADRWLLGADGARDVAAAVMEAAR